jgi:hypothetical protein
LFDLTLESQFNSGHLSRGVGLLDRHTLDFAVSQLEFTMKEFVLVLRFTGFGGLFADLVVHGRVLLCEDVALIAPFLLRFCHLSLKFLILGLCLLKGCLELVIAVLHLLFQGLDSILILFEI